MPPGSKSNHDTTEETLTLIMCHQRSVETHYSFIGSSSLANPSSLVLLAFCIFSLKQEHAVLWCNGYHVCFTRRRSPVQTRLGAESALVSFSHIITSTLLQQLKRFQNIFCMSLSNKKAPDSQLQRQLSAKVPSFIEKMLLYLCVLTCKRTMWEHQALFDDSETRWPSS